MDSKKSAMGCDVIKLALKRISEKHVKARGCTDRKNS
jgi:hypothetical protein